MHIRFWCKTWNVTHGLNWQICIWHTMQLCSFSKLCHFTYVTAHSPTLPSLYLCHSSFSNPSFASPTSQDFHLRHLVSRPWCANGVRRLPNIWQKVINKQGGLDMRTLLNKTLSLISNCCYCFYPTLDFIISNQVCNISTEKKITTTPLLDFLRQRRAERQRMRDERREERRRKDQERKRLKDADRDRRRGTGKPDSGSTRDASSDSVLKVCHV